MKKMANVKLHVCLLGMLMLATPGKNNLFRQMWRPTLNHLHENWGIKLFSQLQWAYFVIIQARAELYWPGQITKSTNSLVDLLFWLGLCSSALAWPMMKYAHLGVGWMIFRGGFMSTFSVWWMNFSKNIFLQGVRAQLNSTRAGYSHICIKYLPTIFC